MQILVLLTILVFLFILLSVITDEYFIPILEKLSQRLKLSSEAVGSTLMAAGSSAPELFTSLLTILRAKSIPSLGAGTIIGSAIFNVLVITGASLLVKRAKLNYYPILRDLIFYSFSIVFIFLAFSDKKITLIESSTLFFLYLVYLFLVKNWNKWFKYKQKLIEIKDEDFNKKNFYISFITSILDKVYHLSTNLFYQLLVSISFIGITTHFLVEIAVRLAEILNMPPAIIGLTILATGTSIPDLISSIIVAKKGYADMAITNALGSNIFDILFGLGFPYLLFFIFKGWNKTIPVVSSNLQASIILLFFTILVTGFIFLVQRWKTKRRSGAILILIYILYVIYLLSNFR